MRSRYSTPGRRALEELRAARASGPLVQGGQGRTAAEVSASAGHVLAALAGAAVGLGLMFLTGCDAPARDLRIEVTAPTAAEAIGFLAGFVVGVVAGVLVERYERRGGRRG